MNIIFKAPLIALTIAISATNLHASQLRIATDSGSRGSPVALSMEKWGSLITEATAGTSNEIKVDIFYQDELGGQQEIYDLHIAGEVDMMITWPQTSYDTRMGLRNVPYMFVDWEQAFEAYAPNGWLNDLYNEVHNDLGLKFFGAYPEGFSGVATRGRYARNIADARGLKIRVPANFPNPQTLQAMGYSSESIAWGEVYTSLQTGVVDGDGGNVIYWDYEYFRDVLDYYVRTRQTFVTGVLSMNLASWDKLNEEQQQIVSDAAFKVSQQQFTEARERDNFYVEKAIEAGMEYIELSEDEIKELATATRERVWPLLEREFSKELVEQIRNNAVTF